MEKIYDFDSYIERRGTHCVKHDALKENFGRDDLIPLWVADMDFRAPQCVQDALRDAVEFGIFGYEQNLYPLQRQLWLWKRQKKLLHRQKLPLQNNRLKVA